MAEKWGVRFIPEALDDLDSLSPDARETVLAAIAKTARMLAESGGTYGKPLGNRNGIDLSGCYKIRVGSLRVVYALERVEESMAVVVVGARDEKAVYREAARRMDRLR